MVINLKLTIIGTGYVGLVSGVCFSEKGNSVICVDKDQRKVDMLNQHKSPIFEPGLEELIEKNANDGRLQFTSDIDTAIKDSEVIIIAVGTPSLPNGEADLSFIEQVAKDIAKYMNEYKIIMTKSTVPVGTNHKIKKIIQENTPIPFDVVSVPEFLREGSAIYDTMNPDRIVIGTDNQYVADKITELHKSLTENIIVTDIKSAEMIKYASNAFLATKISFINEIANICDKVGANVNNVAKGMGMDKRIGCHFLNAGIGYGGSCFPKDTDALVQIAGNVDYDFKLLKSVIEVNKSQRYNVIEKLVDALGDLNGKRIAIWGLAFKPNTDDIREAPSIEIIGKLIEAGAEINAYDPIAIDNFKRTMVQYEDKVNYCDSALETVKDCDAICLLTEWQEFKNIDLVLVEKVMKTPVLIDGRNVFTNEQISQTNIKYYSIGRPVSESIK